MGMIWCNEHNFLVPKMQLDNNLVLVRVNFASRCKLQGRDLIKRPTVNTLTKNLFSEPKFIK